MFKTLDPKSSQKISGGASSLKKTGDTNSTMKLPPIGRKGHGSTAASDSVKVISRNPSKKGQLFGAKSIDLLKSL